MTLGRTRKLPTAICPHCSYKVNACSVVGKDGETPIPRDGDVTLCINCGEWCAFTKGLCLRKPTDDELFEIGMNKECRASRKAWFEMNEERAKQ